MGRFRIVDRLPPAEAGEREAVVAALRARDASIAPKYFYDDLGCALYGAICRLPEYYPTRTELALFEAQRAAIAAVAGRGAQFVDLGAGDCVKGQGWIPALAPRRYVAVDIAIAELARALERLAADAPGLELLGVATDFMAGLPLEDLLDASAATFFYPGSSIGNFTPAEAVGFLARVHALCATRPGSGLLIGVDAKKDKAVLDAAYDDALGVTAAFNRNALRHLNRRFGLDFEVDAFVHRGFYDGERGRIEMHLEATRPVVVSMDGEVVRRFESGERIHTENSYKYSAEEFEDVLRAAGFARLTRWSAPGESYFVFHAA